MLARNEVTTCLLCGLLFLPLKRKRADPRIGPPENVWRDSLPPVPTPTTTPPTTTPTATTSVACLGRRGGSGTNGGGQAGHADRCSDGRTDRANAPKNGDGGGCYGLSQKLARASHLRSFLIRRLSNSDSIHNPSWLSEVKLAAAAMPDLRPHVMSVLGQKRTLGSGMSAKCH
jgi:hypothetical protein